MHPFIHLTLIQCPQGTSTLSLCTRDTTQQRPALGSLHSSGGRQRGNSIEIVCAAGWGVCRKTKEGREFGAWGGVMPFHVLFACYFTLGCNSSFSYKFLCSIGLIFQGQEILISPVFQSSGSGARQGLGSRLPLSLRSWVTCFIL